MEINFNIVLKDLDGDNIMQTTYSDELQSDGTFKKNGEDILTLGIISRSVLLNLSPEELKLTGEKKQDRYLLAVQVRKSEKDELELDLRVEDIALLKELIGKKYMPLVIGAAWSILDPCKETKR